MKKSNTMELFKKEAPEVAEAFNNLIQKLMQTDGLDQKTKQLIYIGIKASLGDAESIRWHAPMAKKAGATREEVRDAVLISLTVSGIKGVSSCLAVALETFDDNA